MKQHIQLSTTQFAIVTYHDKPLREKGDFKYVEDKALVEQTRIVTDIQLYENNESGTEARIFYLQINQFLNAFELVKQLMAEKVPPIAVEDIDY